MASARDDLGATHTLPDGLGARDDSRPIDRLQSGDSVGQYTVIARLGSGATGVVYAAEDTLAARKVALKVLRSDGVGPAAEATRRLVREGRAMSALSHENIVGVLEVGTHDDQLFVAMELVDGVTLKDWLYTEPRAWGRVVEVFAQAGRGLAAAHAAGIIHRDFKPENAMLDRSGRVRVTDFGLARLTSVPDELGDAANDRDRPRADRLLRTGAIMGTPAYMAPEQHLGLPTSAETDQFNFCVSLYEGLYRVRPFGGETRADLARAVTQGLVRAAPADSRVPAAVRSVVLRGLAVQPHDRFESLTKLLDEIERACCQD